MPEVLVASDASWVHQEIRSILVDPQTTVREINAGADVVPAVNDRTPDLVIVDLQIGNMGGMATCLDLRLEESGGRLPRVPVLMLLDRRADVFLARRASADGWLVKPLDPIRLRKAVKALIRGGTYFDDSYVPVPVLVASPADSPADAD
jgi:DNA-binding response OmpR family regulator